MKHERANLAEMATSADVSRRLEALRLMRERIAAGRSPRTFFDLARSLIDDPNNNCRWQAVIVVGESIEEAPEKVWEVVCEFGISEDEDMRDAVATVLLEHLLEHHFAAFFPRLEKKIKEGAPLLADTLKSCWPFGEAEARWSEVRALLDRQKTDG
jgi:hypothetical protein